MNPMGFAFITLGVLTILGAAFQWSWFMNNGKAKQIASLFGHNGARVFYLVLGLFLVALGIVALLGLLPNN